MFQEMMKPVITGIMACDPKGAIGLKGQLPWDYPEDLSFFKEKTKGHLLIMGRKTFETFPASLLPSCFSIVLSQKKHSFQRSDHFIFVQSIQECLSLEIVQSTKQIFMIGGGEIAAEFLKQDLLNDFFLTQIHQEYEGDAFFPLSLLENWTQTLLKKTEEFSIYYKVPPE